jgi:hypothetical protein
MPVQGTVKTIDVQCVIPVKCCISFKTMLCPNFLMVWHANIIIFSGFVVEIQHLTGITHCASFSGMEQFGSGSRGTVNCFTPPAILNSQNYCPSVLEITWKLLPSASGNSSQVISSTSGQ